MSETSIGQIWNEHSYFVPEKSRSTYLLSDTMESHPTVIHIMEEKSPQVYISPDPGHSIHSPMMKAMLFYPHWVQNIMDKNVRFYLSPIEDENDAALEIKEGRILMSKIRYLFARITWDAIKTPIGVRFYLAENHGNKIFPKRRLFRPMLADFAFVENKADISIQGTNFELDIGLPFLMDIHRRPNDPGYQVRVGFYSRRLDINPSFRLKWYASLRREDLPQSAVDAAVAEEDRNEDMEDDEDEWDEEDDVEDNDDDLEHFMMNVD